MKATHNIKKYLGRLSIVVFDSITRAWEKFTYRFYKKTSKLLPSYHSLRFRFMEDMRRFEESAWIESNGGFHSDSKAYRNPENLSAIITMEYHRLEKGLALPNRRVGAGQDVVVRLLNAVEAQFKLQGVTDEGAIGLNTIVVYLKENSLDKLSPTTVEKLPLLDRLRDLYAQSGTRLTYGGYKNVNSSEVFRYSGQSQVEFLKHRHSIRDYTDDPISESLVEEIIGIALSAPSVCNRQAWSVYALFNKDLILNALSYQNGNRGFTDRIPLVLVVCADLRRFVSVEERNQAWIDGGLFSMNLMLAIHAKKLGACPLNWSATRENDNNLRNFLNIPNHEVIIMMMSVGNLPATLKVTDSPRRDVKSILKIIK